MSIKAMLESVNSNTTGVFKRDPDLVLILTQKVAQAIGDEKIYISEFIIAKIKGMLQGKAGHLEITDEIFMRIPASLSNPKEILRDLRSAKKYLFINIDPLHEIAVEVARRVSGKTEINTIHIIRIQELKRLERKFPVVYSSGGTP